MNNSTRRHPRTLSEAFGPYAGSDPVHPMPEPRGYSAAWWIAFAVVSLIGILLIVHFAN